MTAKIKNTAKVCIFCGKKPESKTKEHVIPKWLIEMTGDINRIITLGINWNQTFQQKEVKEMKFSFNSFQFPACKTCNEDYSHLESKSKAIIEKILSDDYLNVNEIDILLDWFDKVRIGLWLGFLSLEKGFYPVNPRFHVANRIGAKDRALTVYKFNDKEKGIQFGGVNLPCFSFNPSCFSLVINNYLFYNISHDFIFSKNLGFPYPKNVEKDKKSGGYMIDLEYGSGKVKDRPFRIPFLYGGIEIYQPMIQKEVAVKILNNYLNEYVTDNLLKENSTHGSIFFVENNRIEKMDLNDELILTPEKIFYRDEFMERFSKHLLNMQIQILNYSPLLNNNIDKRLMNIVIKGQKELSKIKGLK